MIGQNARDENTNYPQGYDDQYALNKGAGWVIEGNPIQPIPGNQTQYINPDEALFRDSQRPRDQYGFHVKPGVNTPKWDWKGSMSGTYLPQELIKGSCLVQGKSGALNFVYPQFKKMYTAGDFSDIIGYKIPSIGPGGDIVPYELGNDYASKIASEKTVEKTGGGIVSISNRGYIKINQGGTYMVQFYSDYIYQFGHKMEDLSKILCWLMYTENGGTLTPGVRMQQRCCSSIDGVGSVHIGKLEKGSELTLGLAYTNGSESVLCQPAINVVKLS